MADDPKTRGRVGEPGNVNGVAARADVGSRFKPGQSGNPSGRPSFAAALKACGIDTRKLSVELIEKLLETIRTLNPGDKEESASWRYAMGELLNRHFGKVKDQVELTGAMSEEQQALLEALKLTPHERRKAMAQDTTLTDAPAATDDGETADADA